MDATHVTVRITKPADPDRFRERFFLVDTGVTDFPRSQAKLGSHRP